MRFIAALFFLMLGVAFPLLLNGQEFTNSLLGIACASAAVALALRPLRDGWGPEVIVVGLGVLLIAALLAHLPSAYRVQGRFNREREQLRPRGHRADVTGKVLVLPPSS
jgi:hypothetical protein